MAQISYAKFSGFGSETDEESDLDEKEKEIMFADYLQEDDFMDIQNDYDALKHIKGDLPHSATIKKEMR